MNLASTCHLTWQLGFNCGFLYRKHNLWLTIKSSRIFIDICIGFFALTKERNYKIVKYVQNINFYKE